MRFVSRLSFVLGLSLLAGLVNVSAVQAAPVNGDWTFIGTLTAPARSSGNVTATLSGTASISAATLQAVGCDDTVTAPPRGVIALRNTGNSSVLALSGTGMILTSDLPTAVSATATIAPGATYELVLQYRCGVSGSIRGTITPATSVTVTVASQVSTRAITRACLPTVPETPCTSLGQQVSSIPVGLSLTFAGIIATTWNDGVTTEAPVGGSQSLQRYNEGSWSTVSGSCAATLIINVSDPYRCSSTSGGQHEQVAITAMQPTTSLTIAPPVVTPITTLIGEPARVKAPVLMNYSDGSAWPAPTTITYKVEFLPWGGTSPWQTVTGPHNLDSRGNVDRAFAFPGTGRIRITAGSASSKLVEIVEASASKEYFFTNVDLPTSAVPGQQVTATATVGQKWTDGVVRNPTVATEVRLEYAIAYTPTLADATWFTAESRQLPVGNSSISFSFIPQGSGFWRLRAGSGTSTPAYIPVAGSRAPQVSAALEPVAGSEPFAGRPSNYRVSVGLDGYVGTEGLDVFVELADASTRVGSIARDGSLNGTFSLRGPTDPGIVTPAFILRDKQGFAWARVDTAPFVIDGLVTFEPVLLQPDPVPLDGTRTTFVARMEGRAFSGSLREGGWSGPSELQELVGGQWTTVARAQPTTNSLVTFTAEARKGSQYRVTETSTGIATPPLLLRVLVPTGPHRFLESAVQPSRVELGDSATVSVQVETRYDDGNFHNVPDGSLVSVLYRDSSGTREIAQVDTVDGRISVTLRPRLPGDVIFVPDGGTPSEPFPVNLVRPDSFDITWPTSIPAGKPLSVSFFARASDGLRWSKPIVAVFQYQAYGSTKWTTLRRVIVQRGKVGRAQAVKPKPGIYRVYSPEFKFFKDARYGTAS